MRVAASFVAVSFVGMVLGGCQADLGTCDMTAAKQVVYSAAGTPFYTGQALVNTSCANGLCHAETAVGDSRVGAPHGLNFDVVPLTALATQADLSMLETGLAKIRDRANNMWGQIEGGTMPPGAAGAKHAIPETWRKPDGSTTTALDIATPDGKATVRNWLACNAPVVAGVTGAPPVAQSIGDVLPPMSSGAVPGTFQYVYDNVLSGSCKACHIKGGPFASQTPLDFTTVTTAYASLVNQDASATGSCVGHGKLVTAGNCDTSLLYQKLAPTPPAVCGALMPFNMPPISTALHQSVCDWIKAGALP
jgi:hypothetical protein